MSGSSESQPPARGRVHLLFLALYLSGTAGLINQTVWQRALKLRLAGSEAISSMMVVLVFLFGVGAGSILMARKANRLRRPLRALGLVELALCATTFVVALALSLDVAESADSLRRVSASFGVPLPLFSAVASGVLLLGPCLLIGVTMPLVSEGAQRELGLSEAAFLPRFFCVNTLGAVMGVLLGGVYLLPFYGQRAALLVAAAFNLATGLLVLGISSRANPPAPEEGHSPARGGLRVEECMAFVLGFLALGYEMYLFRLIALTNTPLPYNFAAALCGYLFWWSLGAFIAGRRAPRIQLGIALTAAAVLATPSAARLIGINTPIGLSAALLTLPCLGFGVIFGWLLQSVSVSWGNDVGRFHGINTLGSCAGILAVTLVGYEYSPTAVALSIGFGYLLLLAWVGRVGIGTFGPNDRLVIATTVLLAAAAGGLGALQQQREFADPRVRRAYYGREGVVELVNGRAMVWDGLWHSALATKEDFVGTPNWYLATVPLLSRRWEQPIDALVIGLGTGITAGTLARSDAVRSVDIYELNPRLAQLLADYPSGTLWVGTNSKVHITWGDGRTGLALSDKKYDLITQQPLYLKQAGSSLFLSREYMALARKHLKPGGVLCLYCNSGEHKGQALVVRKTATTVFPYGESFGRGYMLILSDRPIDYPTPESFEMVLRTFGPDDIVGQELRKVNLPPYHDVPRLDWEESPVIVTDDHPIVEYPDVADYRVSEFKERSGRP